MEMENITYLYSFVDYDGDPSANVRFWDIEADYVPGRAGRFSGPPDRCYPAEGAEIYITKVTDADSKEPIPEEVWKPHTDAIHEQILEAQERES